MSWARVEAVHKAAPPSVAGRAAQRAAAVRSTWLLLLSLLLLLRLLLLSESAILSESLLLSSALPAPSAPRGPAPSEEPHLWCCPWCKWALACTASAAPGRPGQQASTPADQQVRSAVDKPSSTALLLPLHSPTP